MFVEGKLKVLIDTSKEFDLASLTHSIEG